MNDNKVCGDAKRNLPGYCHPDVYHPLPVRFYRNRGDGTFEDATQSAGFGGAVGPGLGVVFGDIDNDGWQDVFIANDNKPNFLFHNKGNGTFEDISLLSGTSMGNKGRPEAGMGVDMGDFDNDGLLDIVVTNFELETFGLYKNLGGDAFLDDRAPARIAEPTSCPWVSARPSPTSTRTATSTSSSPTGTSTTTPPTTWRAAGTASATRCSRTSATASSARTRTRE